MDRLHDMDRRLRLAVALLIAAVGVYISSATVADPDLWGHVRFGQDILASHSIPTVDPYSYLTEQQRWLNHEWLSEVFFAAAFNAGGPAGLLVLKTSILLAIVALLFWQLRAQDVRTTAAGTIVLLVVFIMEVGNRTIRPQLFTYLFFLLLLLTLHAASRRPRRLWWAAPIIAVWANFHGGFLAGLALLAVWSAISVATLAHVAIKQRVPFVKPCCQALLPALAALTAALLNPYGPKLLQFLWETATVSRPDVMEWQPVDITKTEGIAYLTLLGLSILALARSPRRPSPARIAVLACTAIMPFQALRHLPLAALAIAVLAGEDLGAAWQRWLSVTGTGIKPSPSHGYIVVFPLAGALLLSGASLHNCLRITIDPKHAAYPARAVDVLQRSAVRGNMAVYFDWGEYVLWHLSPQIKISYDGRRETVYPESLRQLNTDWAAGVGRWDALLDDYPTDLALLDRRLPGYNLMRLKVGWKLVYEDSLCALFTRDESAMVRAIRSVTPSDLPADGGGMCFP
jgi:hypothetical protein